MLHTLLLLMLLLVPPLPSLSLTIDISSRNALGLGIWFGSAQPPTTQPSPQLPAASSYTALQTWKQLITSDPHNLLSSWTGPDVCSYRGVFCSPPPSSLPQSSPVVAVIDLNNASLSGTLPSELSLLSHLTAIHLNSNRFSGTLPSSLSSLPYLAELDLSNNLLSGPFPSVVLSMPSLLYLDLRFNRFSGALPDDLFSRAGLDAILLNNNDFSGPVPASLWSSSASVINLANNRLSGPLPIQLPSLPLLSAPPSGLREAVLLNNAITGCVPASLGALANLELLDLSYNSLVGHLPDSIACLSVIEVLNFAHNELSGVLSELVCALRSLVNLTISFNFFSGLGQDCGKLISRSLGFDFSGNCISGREMQRPPPECGGDLVPGVGLSCLSVPLVRPLMCIAPMGKGTTSAHSP